jgi:hypothetical protein
MRPVLTHVFSDEGVRSRRAGIAGFPKRAARNTGIAEVGEKLAVVVAGATAAEESETRVTEYHFSQRYLCTLV